MFAFLLFIHEKPIRLKGENIMKDFSMGVTLVYHDDPSKWEEPLEEDY